MTGRRTAQVARVLIAMLCAVGIGANASARAATGHVYKAPFSIGPAGGDQFSYHSANADGTITVARVYPIPGVINCTKGAPYAKLLVVFHATRAVRKVVATYDSALVDPFTFIQVGLRDRAHHWYGLTTVRGMVSGSGTVTLRPNAQQGRLPGTLVVEFGLEQSSACPNADEGTIHFSAIAIS